MIQHVAIEIREQDAEACVRFWALLGFEHVAAPPALADRVEWLQRRQTQVHLLLTDDPVIPPQGHVAVVVEDYEAVLAGLRAAGLDPRPRTEYWGSPRTFVRAPSGHRVELIAFAPY